MEHEGGALVPVPPVVAVRAHDHVAVAVSVHVARACHAEAESHVRLARRELRIRCAGQQRVDEHRILGSGVVHDDPHALCGRELEPGRERPARGVARGEVPVLEPASGRGSEHEALPAQGSDGTRNRQFERQRSFARRALGEREALLEAGGRVLVPLDEPRTPDLDARGLARELACRDRREHASATRRLELEPEQLGAGQAVVHFDARRREVGAQRMRAIRSLEAPLVAARAVFELGDLVLRAREPVGAGWRG